MYHRFISVFLSITLVASFLVISPQITLAATYTVTNTNDSGLGSFRQAVLDANSAPGVDTITFNISGTGPFTINSNSEIYITDSVIVDGYSQSGAVEASSSSPAVLQIAFNWNGGATGATGLILKASGCTVKGLAIQNFTIAGIAIDLGFNNNVIHGNYIGTDYSGTSDQGNTYGIYIYSSNNIIGGTTPAERNLISGNNVYGVMMESEGAFGNTVLGNYIGTNALGTASIGNGQGVRITNASNNTVGGMASGARNLLSGNTYFGIAVTSDGAGSSVGNEIFGNFIGTDVTGTSALGNGNHGIILDGPGVSGTIIGGPNSGEGNLISGNFYRGIQIGNLCSGTQVMGNYIGTDVTGTKDIGNLETGLMIHDSANNTIGGLTPGAANIISGNDLFGIAMYTENATNNMILGNYIGTNFTVTDDLGNGNGAEGYGLHVWFAQNNLIKENIIHFNDTRGINIDGINAWGNTVSQNSISRNDAASSEGGINLVNHANQDIHSPLIQSVTTNTVNGIASSPDGSIIEIFQDTGCQGNIYIGWATVKDGKFTFIGSAPSGAMGGNLTATVTDPDGNTSMFSTPVVNDLGTSSTPEEQIEEIHDKFDNAVSTGDIVGEGPGNSSKGKLNALRNMLERAEELIDQGMIDEAIQQLEDAYKRVDGNPKPPDFAVGDEVDTVAAMILNLIDSLRKR